MILDHPNGPHLITGVLIRGGRRVGVRDGTVLPALKREEGVGSQCQRIQVRLEPEKARDASARGSWTRSLWLVVPVAHGPSGMRQISDSDLQNYERVLVCGLKVLSCRYFATRSLGLGLLIDWLKPESRAAVRRWVAWWIRKSWRLPGAAPLWS